MKRAFLLCGGLVFMGGAAPAHGITLAYQATGVITSAFSSPNPPLYATGNSVFLRFSYDTESYAPRPSNGDDPPAWSVLMTGIIGLGGTPITQFSNFPLWEESGVLHTYTDNAFGGELLTLTGEPEMVCGSFGFQFSALFLPSLSLPASDSLADNGWFHNVVAPGVEHEYGFVLTGVRAIPEPSSLGVAMAFVVPWIFIRRSCCRRQYFPQNQHHDGQ